VVAPNFPSWLSFFFFLFLYSRTARAALRFVREFPFLSGVSNVVHHFNERGLGRRVGGRWGRRHRCLDIVMVARAALVLSTRGFFALQLALRLGAVGGLDALVEARQFLAHGRTLGFGRFAGGVAMSRLAHRLALGAAFLLALVLGAANGADRLLAVDGALGTTRLFALHLAFGSLAHGVANCRAARVVALPLASGVAGLSRNGCNQKANYNESKAGHLL